MTSRISKLILAAVLAGSIPAAASARDRDHDHDRDCNHDRDGRPAVVVSPAPWQPVPVFAPPGPPPRHAWRDRHWLERERAAVRAELAALDAERARFHAQNAWRPGRLRRYDRAYYERRSELVRRWSALQPVVAWR